MKTVLIVTHEKSVGPGIIDELVFEMGFDKKILHSPEENIEALDALKFDLAIIMGGPMGVYEADKFPFLYKEIEFLKKRIAADKPTLGICLGSQLTAAALGEKVFIGKSGKELGWHPLKDVSQNAAVKHFVPEKTSIFHWHGDTFDLPKGAELLASSSLYKNQAFRFGKNIMALQFHPEMTKDMALDWIDELAQDADELKAETERHIKTMNAQMRLFFKEWLKDVGL